MKLIISEIGEGDNIREHGIKLFDLIGRLDEVNQENEELRGVLLHSSLPTTSDNFPYSVESRDDLPTFEHPLHRIKLLVEIEARKGGLPDVTDAFAVIKNHRRKD